MNRRCALRRLLFRTQRFVVGIFAKACDLFFRGFLSAIAPERASSRLFERGKFQVWTL